jgi:hypothetical protein
MYSLFAVTIMLVIGASHWRRSKLRRAVRDLPTMAQRQLGPEPDYLPPNAGDLSDDLRSYAALHKRSRRVMHVVWSLGAAWLVFVLFLLVRGTPQ